MAIRRPPEKYVIHFSEIFHSLTLTIKLRFIQNETFNSHLRNCISAFFLKQLILRRLCFK